MKPDFEVCILAGGLSSRMGRDKSRVRLGGQTFLKRIQETVAGSGETARVIRRDLTPRCGPLGGVQTALATTKKGAVLFLSCDMPFITAKLLKEISGKFGGTGKPVFSQTSEGLGFPFMLGKTALPMVDQLLGQKRFSVQNLAKTVDAKSHLLPESRHHELLNINTPGELAAARRLWRDGQLGAAPSPAPPMSAPGGQILEVSGLGIRRGATAILDDISWRVARGEHWVILGANGSGKTSLLSALTGYLSPTRGKITVLGSQFGRTDWRELRKKVGLVSSSIRQLMADSEPAIETVVSGKTAMIDLWGEITEADRRQARRILRQVDCAALEDRPWLYLSQGERQRILIGRALMARPPVLILDEPCAGLDPAAREHFLQFLNRLGSAKRGPTLILVTHHVEEIMPVFSHALILKNGRTLASGPRESALTPALLAEAFGSPLKLGMEEGRYFLQIAPSQKRVV